MVKRRARIAVIVGLLVVLVALSVVLPGGGLSVVTVSRVGSKVRLLPSRPTLSFLPFADRVEIAQQNGAAVFDVPISVPTASGPTLDARLSLAVDGSGPLPIDAGAVRERGWESAWNEWAMPLLDVEEEDIETIVRTSPTWKKIFPNAPRADPLVVTDRLAGEFAPVSLADARIRVEKDQPAVRAAAGLELGRRVRTPGRLIVLGLDALDWRLVDDLTRKGLMPNIQELIDRGAQAEVIVRPPLLSPLIWTSIATGVNPEVHGVLDFVERDPAGGEPSPIGSAARKVPALWEIAATAGRTTAVIGWWATFPAVAPPGATVYSDRLTEQIFGFEGMTEGSADPPEAIDAADRLRMRRADFSPEILSPIIDVSRGELDATLAGDAAWEDPISGILRLMAPTHTIERLTDHELSRGTEVVLVYLEGTDMVGHLFGPHRPPPLPIVDRDEAQRFGSVVDRYYAHVDRWIGRVAAKLGSQDTLAIVSDHGFRWFEDRPLVAAGAHTATAEQWHRKEAVFIVAGPTVRRGETRHVMTLLDMSASLFALAGLPVGEGMPGVVPGWVVAGPDRVSGVVDYASLVSLAELHEASRWAEVSPEGKAAQLAKLRALGYIGDAPRAADAETGPSYDRFEARRLHNLAMRLMDAGDLEGAEGNYRGAVAADPTYVPPHYAFAFLLRKTGRYEEADRHFWQAVDLDSADGAAPAIVRVAQHYRTLEEVDRAEAVLAEGTRRFPGSATIWLHLGALLGEKGDLEGSRRCLDRAVELDPRDPFAHRNLAALQVAAGDLEGARRSLSTALELEPGNDEVRRQLAGLGGPVGN